MRAASAVQREWGPKRRGAGPPGDQVFARPPGGWMGVGGAPARARRRVASLPRAWSAAIPRPASRTSAQTRETWLRTRDPFTVSRSSHPN